MHSLLDDDSHIEDRTFDLIHARNYIDPLTDLPRILFPSAKSTSKKVKAKSKASPTLPSDRINNSSAILDESQTRDSSQRILTLLSQRSIRYDLTRPDSVHGPSHTRSSHKLPPVLFTSPSPLPAGTNSTAPLNHLITSQAQINQYLHRIGSKDIVRYPEDTVFPNRDCVDYYWTIRGSKAKRVPLTLATISPPQPPAANYSIPTPVPTIPSMDNIPDTRPTIRPAPIQPIIISADQEFAKRKRLREVTTNNPYPKINHRKEPRAPIIRKNSGSYEPTYHLFNSPPAPVSVDLPSSQEPPVSTPSPRPSTLPSDRLPIPMNADEIINNDNINKDIDNYRHHPRGIYRSYWLNRIQALLSHDEWTNDDNLNPGYYTKKGLIRSNPLHYGHSVDKIREIHLIRHPHPPRDPLPPFPEAEYSPVSSSTFPDLPQHSLYYSLAEFCRDHSLHPHKHITGEIDDYDAYGDNDWNIVRIPHLLYSKVRIDLKEECFMAKYTDNYF